MWFSYHVIIHVPSSWNLIFHAYIPFVILTILLSVTSRFLCSSPKGPLRHVWGHIPPGHVKIQVGMCESLQQSKGAAGLSWTLSRAVCTLLKYIHLPTHMSSINQIFHLVTWRVSVPHGSLIAWSSTFHILKILTWCPPLTMTGSLLLYTSLYHVRVWNMFLKMLPQSSKSKVSVIVTY